MTARVPEWAHYRPSTVASVKCATCDFFDGATSRCQRFEGRPPVDPGYVCDKFQNRIEKLQPKVTADPRDPLSQSDLQMLASAANAIEPARVDQLTRKDYAPGAIPFDSPRTLVGKAAVVVHGVGTIPPEALAELARFWEEHPDLRHECKDKYGYDPLLMPERYWPAGLAEPEHHEVLSAVRAGGAFTLPLVRRWESQELAHAEVEKADRVRAAGIAVRAADTGRVLMLQRAGDPRRDEHAGKWEFPGGRLNDGEHPHDAARREWQEEMGVRLPRGKHAGSWRSGVYQGFVH